VSVVETIEKNGLKIFRCHVDETVHQRALEIPAWMFDRACRNMSTAEVPAVSYEALHNVKTLLSVSSHDWIVKEAEREGGAHAKETASTTDTDGPVSSGNENPHVVSDAPKGATNDDPLDVAIAAPAQGHSTPAGGQQ
jgi:hypothetical protein